MAEFPIEALGICPAEEQIRDARKRVEDQKTKLQRLIVQGAPTQAAEDLLGRLHKALQGIAGHGRSGK